MKIATLLTLTVFAVLFIPSQLFAQTTEFTQRGILDTSLSGLYDFEFRLYDVATGGTALAVQQHLGVEVTNGLYQVNLEFGDAFMGRSRYLEIGYKNLPGPFTTIFPRKLITSAPCIRVASDATFDQTSTPCVASITDDQIAHVSGDNVVGQKPLSWVPDGSSDYIQNTTAVQVGANFNIDGGGTVGGTLSGNTVNAVTQYNINGIRILANAGSQNLFAGENAGAANTGNSNSFFGVGSGQSNTGGRENSFFGRTSGPLNTTGYANSFFGWDSARWNTIGYSNSFFGTESGYSNTSGGGNTFIGRGSGKYNTTGGKNTAIGQSAGFNAGNLTFATAIGAESEAQYSNSIYLGRKFGQDTVYIPGNLKVTGATTFDGNLVLASGGVALFQSNITLTSLGSGGSAHICRNISNQLSFCSSSLRYKTNIASFGVGLDLIKQIKPITFDWKDGGMHDLGLGAEDVAAIEPLLVTYNKEGQVEGVKYDRIGVVLVNAVKEQQAQIEAGQKTVYQLQESLAGQAKVIKDLQTQLSTLNKIVCAMNPTDVLCISPK